MSADARLRQASDAVPVRAALGGMLVLVGLIAVGAAASAYLTGPAHGFEHSQPAADLSEHPAPVARMPFDETVPDAARRDRLERRLHTYRWVDRGRRLVGIPIEEAMTAVVNEAAR